MNEMSDEMLMAYVDGQLDAQDRALVEAYLAANPAATERLSAFMRTGRALGELFAAPMNEPVPARLIDAVMGTPPVSKRAAASTGFSDRFRATFDQVFGGPAYGPALAAVTCGLAIGVASGWSLTGLFPSTGPVRSWEQSLVVETGPVGLMAGHELRRGLDAAASGTTAKLGGGATAVALKPVMTFRNRAGTACRQFEIETSTGQRASGVGCRQPAGDWRIEILAATEAGRASEKSGGGIAPAGRTTSPAIEATVDNLIQGVALGPDDEANLIALRWGKGP